MNQNGFVPRNNMPGYSYGQPNTPPQNGYPGSGTAVPGGGYTPSPPPSVQGGYNPVQPAAPAGGFSPVPQMTAGGGYSPAPQVSATGGFTPDPQAKVPGGYNPIPQAPVTGVYNPVPPAPVNGGYSPVPPSAANTAVPAYHPQTAPTPSAGSFIPKTPYSPGYTGPGYQQQGYQKPAANGYPQGYSAYAQMGRNAPQSTPVEQKPVQVPLNGGGYVPQQVKIRKRPPEKAELVLYAAGGVLFLLFLLGMFIPMPGFQWLKWLFLVPAAGFIALMWVKPITDDNKRLVFSIVAGALCIAMIVSLIAAGQRNTGDPTRSSSARNSSVQVNPDGNATDSGSSGTGTSQSGGQSAGAAPSGNNQTNSGFQGSEESNLQNGTTVANAAAKERLAQVFICWSMNDLDQMVELCLPSWRVKQENAKKSLFQLLQNRTPIGNVDLVNDPAQNGDSLSFLLQVTISRNNGKDPILSQMTVRMVIENGFWYVDPSSLKSNEIQETPDPNAKPVATPSPTPYVDGNTVLYYNPDGGKLYHLDASCISVHSKYTPLKGKFTYSQINEGSFAALEPCNVCAAPLRK